MANFPASLTSYSDTSRLHVLIRRKDLHLLYWCNQLVHLSKITAAAGTKTTSSCRLQLVLFRPPLPMPAQIASVGLQKRDDAEGLRDAVDERHRNLKHTAVMCNQIVLFCSFSQANLTTQKKKKISSSCFLWYQEQSLLYVLWYVFSSGFTNININTQSSLGF